MKELDAVVLAVDLPANGLETGDVGTVVLVHKNEAAYEVEFVALNGETIAVVTLPAAQVRAALPHEIPHVRSVAV
ncbi:MAG: DUF4926 domain-containing protein [Candidatus Sumerlaeota bacterium]|nr:DUF4926 domain-containing protein [Candidatus Sumerlaeota bacterium]